MAGGRPLKFKSVKVLSSLIDNYFALTPEDEWTWTGLALALNTDRQTLADYRDGKGERKEFSPSVKNAMLKIENGYEKDLKKHGRSGSIFALKNFEWKDKSETDVTSKGEKVGPVLVKFIDAENN